MASTVLVTGAAGGLGARLIPMLHDRGLRVRALAHKRGVEVADEQVSGDLLDSPSLERAAAGTDAVLHLAACTHARSDAEYRRVNVRGTENLLRAAMAAHVRRFVYVSSRAIGAQGGGYSASKRAAEESVAASGLEYATVRLPEVFGLGSREGVDQMLDAARAGRPLVVIGHGRHELCPAHVDDVLPALVAAIDSPEAAGRTYTLAGECTTMRDFAERVIAATGGRSRIVRIPVAAVCGLGLAARFIPIPLYPDQLARLIALKPPVSAEAATDLGFRPRALDDAIRTLAG